MMYLGKNAVGIATARHRKYGTYKPETTSTSMSIDVGSTNWDHFLIVAKVVPFVEQTVRQLGMRYFDFEHGIFMASYGTSSGSSYPTNANSFAVNKDSYVSGSIISQSGVASTIGSFVTNVEYEWWAW